MGLKLLRVELVNIRAHEHMIFEPEGEGITALQGQNGAGKSTIVDSIAWTLYGTKPNGVSKVLEIFRVGIDDKDKAFARVDMEVDNRHMRFERRRVNKHGAIEVEVWHVTKDENGDEKLKQEAGPALTHAESYIRKLLRMDEQGFLAAVLIQQKQVDQLITATPRERGRVIERLTGITSITMARDEAKKEYNVLKKSVSFSTIDHEALERLKNELEEVVDEGGKLKESLVTIRNNVSELKRVGESVKAELETASALYEDRLTLERDQQSYELKKGYKEEELASVLQEKDEAKKLIVGVNGESVEELNSAIRDKESIRNDLALDRSTAERELKKLQTRKHECEAILTANEEVTEAPHVIRERIEKITKEEKRLNGKLISAEGEIEKLRQAIGIIDHGDSCPTCLQKVSDVSSALSALNGSIEVLEKESTKNSKRVAKLETERTELKEKLEKALLKAEANSWLSDSDALVKAEKKSLDSAASELRLVEKELKVLREKLDEARQIQQRRENHSKLLKKAQGITVELETIEFELGRIKKELGSMGKSSQREVSALQKKLDDIRSKHSSKAMEYSQGNGELKLLSQRSKHLHADIVRHEEEIKKHNELLQAVEIAAHAHEVITEFREERIKSSIPVIEVYASDLLSRFTEGKFTRLSLNQKFEATVYLADGTPRAVGLLSGGELSAAAMALRLSISLLLNSGADHNLMVLDEVLVSQDVNRAEQILTTLKEVARGQVVLIAHNDAIDAIADKIISLPMSVNGAQSSE